MEFLDPSEFKVTDANGTERTYILSKFPAVQGREIIAKYPTSALPKLGDYAVSEETMLKLMCFVGVPVGGQIIPLSTRALVDNHIADWETLAKIEMAMMEKNCSFFRNGTALASLSAVVQALLQKISEISTPLSDVLSQKSKPLSTNSGQSIP